MMGSMMRRGSFGDGATLDLAFTTMTSTADLTAAGFTFTRSTSATYINASGFVATASANQARFDYDPTSIGTPRGLLIEGSATNLCLNGSMAFTSGQPTSYTRAFSQCTVSSVSSTTFPGQVAWSISATAIGQRDFLEQTIALAANTTYTVSAYVEAITGTVATFAYMTSLPSGASSNTVVNPSAGRVSFTVTVGATAGSGTLRIGIGSATGTGVSADASVRFSHVQVETGAGASSYILTGASTVMRVADKCISDSISGWYTQGIGTVLVSATPLLTTSRTYWNFSVGSSVPRIQLYSSGGTDVTAYLENPSGTGANIAFPTGSISNGTLFKAAWAFQTGSHAACVNGNAVATSSTSSPAVPTSGMTRFNVGHRYDQVNQFYGHIASVKYWPTRLANADLQALTA